MKRGTMYLILIRKNKTRRWKPALYKKTMEGVKNGLFRSKNKARYSAKNIEDCTGYLTKIVKVR